MVMESVRKKFIEGPLMKHKIANYIEEFLSRSWVANVDIQHSPVATKIFIELADSRSVLDGRKRRIAELAEKLKKDLNIENPQINIVQVRNAWLEPKIVAKRASLDLLKGGKIKIILTRLMRSIMAEGARGVEIIADGKLGAKGARSRKTKIYAGFVPKAGDPANKVKEAKINVVTKHGVVGVTVRIATPDIYLPDKPKVEEEKETAESEQSAQANEMKGEDKNAAKG